MECGGTLSAAVSRSYCWGMLMSFMATRYFFGIRWFRDRRKPSNARYSERQRARSTRAEACPMLLVRYQQYQTRDGVSAGYDDQLDGRFDVGVQVHSHVVFTNLTDGAVRQTNFALGHFDAGGGQGIGDVGSTDGTEQLALIACGSSDGDFQFGQLSGTGFGRSLALGSRFFQLGTTCFELGDVGRRSSGGFALGQQVVTTVARLDVYFVAQVAQVRDFFQQDDFHLSLTS